MCYHSPVVSADEACASVLTTPLDNCNDTAPGTNDTESLSYVFNKCYTPVVTAVSVTPVQNVAGLPP